MNNTIFLLSWKKDATLTYDKINTEKLKPGLIIFYDLQPGKEAGSIHTWGKFIKHKSGLIYTNFTYHSSLFQP